MKELNMDWNTIKQIPRVEIQALATGLREHALLHAFDGYNDKDVSEMAKNKPEVRAQYAAFKEQKRKYEKMLDLEQTPKSLGELFK